MVLVSKNLTELRIEASGTCTYVLGTTFSRRPTHHSLHFVNIFIIFFV